MQNFALDAILGFQEGVPSITVRGERDDFEVEGGRRKSLWNKNASPPNSCFWGVEVENRGEIGREGDFSTDAINGGCLVCFFFPPLAVQVFQNPMRSGLNRQVECYVSNC